MGFVYEEVGEENRELWESIGWKDWGERTPKQFFKGRMWSVDREHHIYMQPIGGFRDMPDYYDLAYKGRIVRMEIKEEGSGDRGTGFNMRWNVCRINVPKSIWEEKEEILQAIKESFLVYRAAARESEINSITVNIQCEPECVEVDYNGK